MQRTPIVISASSVTTRELEPLWPGVLWIGKLSLLVGDPGLGKSLTTADVAARVSRGAPWPCGGEGSPAGNVLLVNGEDDIQDTIVPRLVAAGADLERIEILRGVREQAHKHGEVRELWLALDQHLEQLRKAVQVRNGRIRLVIVDPISAFLGGTDSHKNSEVRAVLAGLGRLAIDLRFAVLVVSHLNKGSGGGSALYRITGSLAFVAAARAVFAITKDPEDADRRLLLPVKSNLGPDTRGYAYTIGVADNDAACVRWADTRVTQSADELLAGPLCPREQAVAERASEVQAWLKDRLEHGPQPASAMWTAAAREGHSRRDVERAKRALGIRAEVKGFRGAWHWMLPSQGVIQR